MSENYWSVTVNLNGEEVVTIEPDMISGCDIGDLELEAIRESAFNLLAFAGISVTENSLPPTDLAWLPDDLALNAEIPFTGAAFPAAGWQRDQAAGGETCGSHRAGRR
jgi:hypothetical protein